MRALAIGLLIAPGWWCLRRVAPRTSHKNRMNDLEDPVVVDRQSDSDGRKDASGE
jgi:hypothetical protein